MVPETLTTQWRDGLLISLTIRVFNQLGRFWAADLENGEAMKVTIDPEGHEVDAIHELVDFTGKNVLEVGCGDGRMTWRYAERAASVLAIDPDQERISKAVKDTPRELHKKVVFKANDINEAPMPEDAFDVVVLSYSL